MSTKHNIFHGHFVKNGDKLVSLSESSYKLFIKDIEEGQKVEIFMETDSDDGTVPQLAKIHACIREIAKEVGDTFEEMKKEVKIRSGLCIKKQIDGELFIEYKSFGDCSKEELAMAIATINQIGEILGINFK